jgi:transposase InsO family protein
MLPSSTDPTQPVTEVTRAAAVKQVTVARPSSKSTTTTKPVKQKATKKIAFDVNKLYDFDDIDDDVQHHDVRKRITFSTVLFSDERSQLDHELSVEKHVASSMCLPVILDGVTLPRSALIDQGASHSVMRMTAYKEFAIRATHTPKLYKVSNMSVTGSTGEHLPITGMFIASVSTPRNDDSIPIHRGTIIYVVKNTKQKDIICDLVIGRSTLATSHYSCIDMKGTGALVSTHADDVNTHRALVQCYRCSFIHEQSTGRRQLQQHQPTSDASFNNLRTNTYTERVMRVHTLVSGRTGLNVNERAYLHSHLLMNIDEFTVDFTPASNTHDTGNEHNEQDDFIQDKSDGVLLCHLMSQLDKATPSTVESDTVITQLMATFVPSVVEKPTRIQQQHSEVSETRTESDIDEIEFPFAPPTMKDDSPDYQAAKKTAIETMIRSNTHLTTTQQDALMQLMMKFNDRFSLKGENMERTDSVQHEIDTRDRHPFRERLRQYSPAIQDIIASEVESMIKQGVVVPSRSPYASNLLLVRKPDPSSEGGVKNRVCASFVRLNSDTEKDSYPLPNIQYIFDRIGRSKWFTTMDLLSGFWQVMIKPEHRHKTAFITVRGLYEFVVMPFGLCNAPATFQRLMDEVIVPEYRSFIETYIDDLMTHSSTFDDHLVHLDKLLTSLRKHKLVVKLSKCKFAQQEVKFLGHVISQNAIKTNPEAVEAIKNWMKPAGGGKKAVTAVRGFLGMAGWYRKFIPHFADIAKPLVHLTKNDITWEWTSECQTSFEQLRDALTQSPVLGIADPTKNYILHTDASDHAMGAILQQADENGDMHPIAYASKTFNDAQTRYDTTEREALAITWALQHFNTYCEGHRYTLLTDHKALSYIRRNTKNDKRITRWQLLLQHYNVDIYYVKGKDNLAADLLSRPYMETREQQQHASDISVHALTRSRRRTNNTYEVKEIVGKRPSTTRPGECEYRVRWKGYTVNDDTWEPTTNLIDAADRVADYEKQAAIDRARVETKREDVAYTQPIKCSACEDEFANQAALHIHRYHEHKIDVPTDMLTKLDMNVEPEVFRRLQQQDEQFRCVFNTDLGVRNDIPLNNYEKRTLMNHDFIIGESGLLYMMDVAATRSRQRAHTQLRLCIPKTERQRLLHEYHHRASHPGVVHLYDLLREKVWWPSMQKDVYKYVSNCMECQINNNAKITAHPRPMTLPSKPWSHLATDHVGPFPMSDGGYRYILTIVDRYTRYAEAIPVADTSATTTAQAIVKHIICRYGMFDVLLSDRGPSFTSEIFKHVMQQFGVKHIKTTAYHPKSNGAIERFNKTLKKMLKLWVNRQHTDWDVLLPFALFAYNSSVHSTLKETPFYLNFARQPRTITDVLTNDDLLQRKTVHAYAHEVVERLKTVHEQVIDILQSVNDKRQQHIDNDDIDVDVITAGDSVFLYDETTPVNRSRKLIKRWRGPYVVIATHNNNTSTILKPSGESMVSNDRLRKVNDDQTSIQDMHQRDIALATEELTAINDSIAALMQRQDALQQIAAMAEHVNNDANERARANANIDVDADEHKYDDEFEVDEEEVELNGIVIEPAIVARF